MEGVLDRRSRSERCLYVEGKDLGSVSEDWEPQKGGGVLIVNLPGSPRAALENLAVVWPAVPHCIAKAQGDDEPCGTP